MIRADLFDFELPENLIAQYPADNRVSSRLMVLFRDTGKIQHLKFSGIASYFEPGDVLVLNETKVVKSRFVGRKASGGRVEVLVFRDAVSGGLMGIIKGGAKSDSTIYCDGFNIAVGRGIHGIFEVLFDGISYEDACVRFATIPLPPYIKRSPAVEDELRYQTVFAKKPGAVAAPTASLHFSGDMLDDIQKAGVSIVNLTLHVGPGTFLPIKTDDIEEHRMMTEWYEIPEETAHTINSAVSRGKRVLPCGTTSVRALESATGIDGLVRHGSGATGIFIYPGYEFRTVKRMLTNFHVPRSTPLMMVSALAGRGNIANAYSAAISKQYRFFSYGDAMLIW